MAEEARGKVLVLEDDEGLARLVRLRLERLGHAVVTATSPDEALGLVERSGVDLIVLDYQLRGDVSGLDFHRQLQAAGHDVPAILVTGFSDEAKVIEAIRAGVRDFVPKTPDFLDYLSPAVERVMGQVRTQRQAAESEAVRQDNAQLQRLIAERERLEEELRASNEQLVEADRRKDEFLAMLAHELRNPLAAVSNCINILRRDPGEDRREWCREVIERQTRHLGRLIDDLLDVSRITRGNINLLKTPLDLRDAVAVAAAAVRPMIEERSHALTVAVGLEPLQLAADPTRIEQVLMNLLMNAAKYTDPGGRIRLTARNEGADVVVVVADTGVGIAPEMLPRVFDLFTQADHSLARSQGGLGIGLTLVRRLVELHGGSVAVRSEGLGRGSEFTVRLPRRENPAAAPPGVDPATPRPADSDTGARVLVVEDNVDAALGLAQLLKAAGHDVRAVFDGRAAVDAARFFHPQAVVLDIGLPGMDGYQVARTLRDDPHREAPVVIALSGYGQDRDRDLAREAGFDHHLVKPVDLDALLALLAPVAPKSAATTRRR